MRLDTPSNASGGERGAVAGGEGARASAAPAVSANGGAASANGEAPPSNPYHTPLRGRIARTVIVTSVALTLMTTASIYWRWATVTEPSTFVVVHGTEKHNGTVVVVSSPNGPDAMATLCKENDYAAAIFLHPGLYKVTATLNGEDLVRADLTLSGRTKAWVDLTGRKRVAPGAREKL
jgi:hypothetical protein